MISDEKAAIYSMASTIVLICLIVAVGANSYASRYASIRLACIKAGGNMERKADGPAECRLAK